MSVTVTQIAAKLLAEATYCEKCERDFDGVDVEKYPPNESTIYWTGTDDIICYSCAEADWEHYNEMRNQW